MQDATCAEYCVWLAVSICRKCTELYNVLVSTENKETTKLGRAPTGVFNPISSKCVRYVGSNIGLACNIVDSVGETGLHCMMPMQVHLVKAVHLECSVS